MTPDPSILHSSAPNPTSPPAPPRGESIAALKRLYEDGGLQRVVGYFRRCGLDEAESLELAQNTFVNALRTIDSYRGQSKISTWIWAIAHNERLAHLRRRSKMDSGRNPFSLLAEDDLDSTEDLESDSGTVDVRSAFSKFSNEHKEEAQVIYLAVVDGWTRDEIAGYLGRSPQAATEYLSIARARFSGYLRPEGSKP